MKYRRRLVHRRRPTKVLNIPGQVPIHNRPAVVDGKRFGDWELDLIVGKGQKSGLMTLVEKSKSYILMHRLETKLHEAVKKASVMMLFPFRNTNALKTITTDA